MATSSTSASASSSGYATGIVGATDIQGIVTGPNGNQETVEFLVDTGASYTVLPHQVWQRLGLAPKRVERFGLADGTAIERPMSECHIKLPQGDGHTPVVLGEPGDVPLLGVITLEELGFVINPFSRTLHRMRMLMVGMRLSTGS